MSIRMPLYHETSLVKRFTVVVLHKLTKKMQLLKVLVKEISYEFNWAIIEVLKINKLERVRY